MALCAELRGKLTRRTSTLCDMDLNAPLTGESSLLFFVL